VNCIFKELLEHRSPESPKRQRRYERSHKTHILQGIDRASSC